MQILFLISEVEDIIKTGGLADVGKALPLALAERGHDVRIILPYYKAVERQLDLSDAMPAQMLYIGSKSYSFKVKQVDFNGIPVYFIDYQEYFSQEGLYQEHQYANNAEKFSFFSLAALCAAEALNFQPDVLHCNDWHTSMACYFVKHHEPISDFYAHTSTVLSIHNAAFQGVEPLSHIPCLAHQEHALYIENGYINMLKTGLLHAHKICAVSPSYATEIATPLGSHGIHDVIQQRINDVVGILNGCDYEQWDPQTDEMIAAHYNGDDLSGKRLCKAELQTQFKLPADPDVPLIGMVCRTTLQKGFGYLLPILEELLLHHVQVVIVGTGEQSIAQVLRQIGHDHATKFVFVEDFQPEFAHQVEAGADFFLMPSQFEPCGLNQMYSLAYGTLPIVRGVGGLKDTVNDISMPQGDGFVFDAPSAEGLLSAIRKALLYWHESPEAINAAIKNAMKKRFTWQTASAKYESLYRTIVNK